MMQITQLLAIACVVAPGGASFLSQPFSEKFSKRGIDQTDPSKVGYLGVFMHNGRDGQKVFFDLSNGNNAESWSPLNNGSAILSPTLGSKSVRDLSIVAGVGKDVGKWWILGTDLDVGGAGFSWDTAERHGSQSIFIWESTDLIRWSPERLVKVEDATAGMVWAPDAIWNPAQGQYMVHWSSRIYSASDVNHTGPKLGTVIRHAYTSDFQTFSQPSTYLSIRPASVIDLAFLPLGGNSYARFAKNNSVGSVYMEISDNGLLGSWNRPGGKNSYVQKGREGPYAWWDNVVPGTAYLLLDDMAKIGYHEYVTSNVESGVFREIEPRFPANRKHGSVLSLTQSQSSGLKAAYS